MLDRRRGFRLRSTVGLAVAAVAGAVSVLLILYTPTFTGEDWAAIQHGAELVLSGQSPYLEPLYRWSPVAAWLTLPLIITPYWLWVALHVMALAGFRDPRIFLLGLIAWPFWQDAGLGNVLVFVTLAAWWAVRRNRYAVWAYLVMSVLMPRPLMLPVLVWLLWRQPGSRLPFVAIGLGMTLAALATGYAADWLSVLVQTAPLDMTNPYVVGPSVLFGAAWLVIGIPLAVVLTRWGRLGWASLAASPYWLPYYLLMLLLEFAPRPSSPAPSRGPAAPGTHQATIVAPGPS